MTYGLQFRDLFHSSAYSKYFIDPIPIFATADVYAKFTDPISYLCLLLFPEVYGCQKDLNTFFSLRGSVLIEEKNHSCRGCLRIF